MVKTSTKRTLVAVVVGLLVGYVLLGRSCYESLENKTIPGVKKQPEPKKEESKQEDEKDTLDTTTIALIVIGSLAALGLVVGLGVWGYRKYTSPAYYAPPAYGARRR